jgi:cytochrome c oxidase subunit III
MAAEPMTVPGSRARTGVWVAIATISMSFAAYTSALMVRQDTMSDWAHFTLPPILFVNTLVLLASSATIALGLRRMRAGAGAAGGQATFAMRGGRWLVATLGLGLLFVAGQVLAWRSLAAQGLYLATTPGSSFFYVFTALHALHLLGGVAALAYVLRLILRTPATAPLGAAGATAIYWHFMDVLWLYLLLVLALRL